MLRVVVKAVILCGGRETRWNGYLGRVKQTVLIKGTPLLYRTVEQLRSRGVDDVTVVSGQGFPWQAPPGVGHEILSEQLLWPTGTDADKFLSSRHLWNGYGRTLVVYGDVMFTKEAMDTVVQYPGTDWTLFCRFGPDGPEGPQGGECFVQSFYPQDHPRHLTELKRVARTFKRGLITQCGGWEHYRAMNGVADEFLWEHRRLSMHVEIDDYTDDFDYPETYDRFVELTEGVDLPL